MILSQSFHELPTTPDNFHHSSAKGERVSPSSRSQEAFTQPLMSLSSLSASSSPSSAATPPEFKSHCSSEQGKNGIKQERDNFSMFVKSEMPEAKPSRNESCPNVLLGNIQENNNINISKAEAYCCFSGAENYKFYDQSNAFENPSSTSMAKQNVHYSQTNSLDLTTATDSSLTPSSSATRKKSYDSIVDKELRKKLKNRESAQAARDRKKAKMLSLERQVSELHERYRLVENENQELRIRIQRMEATAYYRMEKQDTNPLSSDVNGMIPFSINGVGSLAHGPSAPDSASYPRSGQYPNLCGFGEYSQQLPQPCISGPENGEEGNLPTFGQMTLETREFQSPSYVQNIWNADNIPSLPNHPHQGNFGGDANYNEGESILG